MFRILAVHINKSMQIAKRSSSKKPLDIDEACIRKSAEDMTIKYWPYKTLKNNLKDIKAVVGIYKGVIYTAFKVKDYRIVPRIGKNNLCQDRVEFLCSRSIEQLIGLDLGPDAQKGGWSVKTYQVDEIRALSGRIENKDGKIKERRETVKGELKKYKIPYRAEVSKDYPQYFLGSEKDGHRSSDLVRKLTCKRSNNTCELCGEDKLPVFCHHIENLTRMNDKLVNTVCVCRRCHTSLHRNKKYESFIKPLLKKYAATDRKILFGDWLNT